MSYIPPTEEEIQEVDAYWALVTEIVSSGRPAKVRDMDPELLRKVNAHRWREKCLACPHPEISLMLGQPPTCTECEQPVQLLSDLQIEVMKEKAHETASLDGGD